MAAFSKTIPDQWCIPITVRLRTIHHPQLTPEVYLVCNTKAHRVKKFTVITGTSPVGVTDIIKELLGDVVKMSQSLGQFFGKRVTERLYCGGFYQLQLLPTNTLRRVFLCAQCEPDFVFHLFNHIFSFLCNFFVFRLWIVTEHNYLLDVFTNVFIKLRRYRLSRFWDTVLAIPHLTIWKSYRIISWWFFRTALNYRKLKAEKNIQSLYNMD